MLRVPMLLLVVTVSQAASPVFKASFDNAEEKWAVDHGSAELDSSVLHEGHKSIRLERGPDSPNTSVRLAAATLTIGKRYELSGWVRTEDLEVRDLDRSPDRHRRRADDGIDAVRRAFRFTWRHSAMDPRLAQVCRQPQPGSGFADGGQWRVVSRQGLV